jgi:hypothetical protein
MEASYLAKVFSPMPMQTQGKEEQRACPCGKRKGGSLFGAPYTHNIVCKGTAHVESLKFVISQK